jgi:hypothetical protein
MFMSSPPAWLSRARHILTVHLSRLGDTLLGLTERVRGSVAQAVSQAVAGAVREAVGVVLAQARAGPAPPRHAPPLHAPPPGLCHGYGRPDPEEDGNQDGLLLEDWSREESEDWRDEEEDDEGPPTPAPSRSPRRARLHSALAVGCQAAAWWLRRAQGTCSTLAALGVGAVCTGATYFLGAGLALPVLGVVALVDAVQSSAALLSWISPS